MSGSSGEKTEQPTPKKLQDARKKGQVAQSQDVNKLFITLAGFEILIAMSDFLLEKVKSLIVSPYLLLDQPFSIAASSLTKLCLISWFSMIAIILPPVIIARFMASFVQYGFLFSPESMKMDFGKFSPVKNGKNIISKKKFVELGSNIVKAVVLTIVFYQLTKSFMGSIVLLSNTSLSESVQFSIHVFSMVARVSLGIFLVVSVVDFIMQKAIFIKSQKMTKDEVFREYKQMEGDPMIKGQRKELAKELASGGGKVGEQVKKADAVVVNPTHFAVAIEYKPGKTPLPLMLCKGVEDRALEIKRYAEIYDIPVIRYVSLARTLFRTGREGKFIPRSTLQAMAAVLRAVQEMEQMETKPGFIELQDPY